MCSEPNSTVGPLTFQVGNADTAFLYAAEICTPCYFPLVSYQPCEGPGNPLHEQEVGYNYSAPGTIPKTGSAGLCVSAGADGIVGLAPCGSSPDGQGWKLTAAGEFVLTSNATMCLSAGPVTPPPLLSNVFGSHMVLQVGASGGMLPFGDCSNSLGLRLL